MEDLLNADVVEATQVESLLKGSIQEEKGKSEKKKKKSKVDRTSLALLCGM